MNPRYRRLLIPGLLAALVLVVIIASATGRADAADDVGATQVSVLSDPRIIEASGLALSTRYDDLGYVINDSGQAQLVFAVTISTGEVVGTTAVTGGQWRDSEALSIDDAGTLWVADTGDNLEQRDDAALYAFDEPGPGDHTIEATRYPVAYEAASQNAETLLIQPSTHAKYLVSKGLLAGGVFELPDPLSTTAANVARRIADAPGIVTDGAFTPDGSRVLLRTYLDVREVDPATWEETGSIQTPPMAQSESLAVESGGRTFLVGSEGESSPLIRVVIPDGSAVPTASATPTDDPVPVDANGDPRANQGFAGRTWAGAAVGLLALLGMGVWVARRN